MFSPYAAMGNSPGMMIDPNGEMFNPFVENNIMEQQSEMEQSISNEKGSRKTFFGLNALNTLMAAGGGGGNIMGTVHSGANAVLALGKSMMKVFNGLRSLFDRSENQGSNSYAQNSIDPIGTVVEENIDVSSNSGEMREEVTGPINTPKGTYFPIPMAIFSFYPTPGYDLCPDAHNECAIRMSFTFSLNGVDVSNSNTYRKIHRDPKTGMLHQPSAMAIADWLHTVIGPPKKMTHPTGEWQMEDFKNKQGIIYFVHPERGGTNSGHIDVIFGERIGSKFYPNREIWFWEYKNGKYLKND